MCGLYGFSGKNPDINKIMILALQNITRGVDSAGVYLEMADQFKLYKEAKRADVFYQDELLSNLNIIKEIRSSTCIIGHNRQKSVGVIKAENAHPFLCPIVPAGKKEDEYTDAIVLAHNGTLKFEYDLRNNFKFNVGDYEVDSQLFALYFARNFGQTEILKRYEGAAALLWKSIKGKTLNAWSDGERPLHYGIINDNIYLSSEKTALVLIGCKEAAIRSLDKRKIYQFEEGKLISVSDEIKFEKFPTVNFSTTGANAVKKPNENTKINFTEAQLAKGLKYLQANKSKWYTCHFYEFFAPGEYSVKNKEVLKIEFENKCEITIDIKQFAETSNAELCETVKYNYSVIMDDSLFIKEVKTNSFSIDFPLEKNDFHESFVDTTTTISTNMTLKVCPECNSTGFNVADEVCTTCNGNSFIAVEDDEDEDSSNIDIKINKYIKEVDNTFTDVLLFIEDIRKKVNDPSLLAEADSLKLRIEKLKKDELNTFVENG